MKSNIFICSLATITPEKILIYYKGKLLEFKHNEIISIKIINYSHFFKIGFHEKLSIVDKNLTNYKLKLNKYQIKDTIIFVEYFNNKIKKNKNVEFNFIINNQI
jgi:hypothetical protein